MYRHANMVIRSFGGPGLDPIQGINHNERQQGDEMK